VTSRRGGRRRRLRSAPWSAILLLGCAASGHPVPPQGGAQATSSSWSRATMTPPDTSSTPGDAEPRAAVSVEAGPAEGEAPVQAPGLARGIGSPEDDALAAGDRAFEADDLNAARQHYERARALDAQDPAPVVGMVRVKLAEADVPLDFRAAPDDSRLLRLVEELDAVLKAAPKYGPAHLERGRIALILGNAPSALRSLRQAVALRPRDPEAHTALGVALLATGSSKEALGHFRRASELDPNDPSRLTNLGTAYMMRGLVEQAVAAYERAVRLAPNDARVQGDLGTAHLAANRPDRAMPYLRRAVQLAPERATFLNNLGYAYQLSGKTHLAIQTYRDALAKDPLLGSAWINLGTAQAQQGDYAAAEASFNRALAIDPSDPRAQANLAELKELRQKRATPKP
jgi:Tfp pilus assembly protein PilF